MVEEITRKAIQEHAATLKTQGLLDGELHSELERLAEESHHLSNWTDASHHLTTTNYQRLSGAGPLSKVLRTFAYLLEQLQYSASSLVEKGVLITRVQMKDTRSGCSDYTGQIVVEAHSREGVKMVLLEGPFVWDCAVHQLPQTQAAQQLGHRCMVSFPEIT